MQVSTVALDLAKDVIQVHAITESGEVVLNRAINRKDLLPFLTAFALCRRLGSVLGRPSLGARAPEPRQ